MATSTINNYTGNGTSDSFLVGFDYLRKSFVKVFLDDVLQELGIDYEFSTDNVITFNTPPANGVSIVIARNTLITETITNYIDPAILSAGDLNKSFTQSLHLIQEVLDDMPESDISKDDNGNIDLGGTRIINSGQPINDNDLATKAYVDINDNDLRDFIENVDSDLLAFSNNVNNKIVNLENTVNDNNTNINETLLQHVDNLQNQIDGIDIAGVKISAEDDNAITTMSDGLFVPDLSDEVYTIRDVVIDNIAPNMQDITQRVDSLDNDSVAQWVIINDTASRSRTNTSNISSNSGRIDTNSTAIDGLETRITAIESIQPSPVSSSGFNTIEYITVSNSAYPPPVEGWYKITIIGGGGGGAGGTNGNSGGNYGGSGGGGGAAGRAMSFYLFLYNDSPVKIVIGSYGAAGAIGTSGGTGGTTSITVNAQIYSVGGGAGGGNGSANAYGGQGGAGGGGIGEVANSGGNGQVGFINGSSLGIGGSGGNGGTNGTPYGGGGGGGGAGGYGGYTGRGGRMGGYGAVDGGTPTTAYGGAVGGRGASGAVILQYFDPNI